MEIWSHKEKQESFQVGAVLPYDCNAWSNSKIETTQGRSVLF